MRGLTIIELLVYLAILSALIAISIKVDFFSTLDRYRSYTEIKLLTDGLNNARLLAIDSKEAITICPFTELRCSTDWQLPIAVFSDSNSDYSLDQNETLHYLYPPLKSGIIKTRSNINSGIVFTPLGHAYSSASTLIYCPNSGNNRFAKQIIISFQGRIRKQNYLTSNATPYSSLGSLSCLD